MLCNSFRSAFYFAWVNLRRRLQSETDNVKSLIDRVKENDGFSDDLFTDRELKQYQTWQKGADRLEDAMLKIDDSIMLFRDF